jgi:predicted RNase H-like HicB family nuclease
MNPAEDNFLGELADRAGLNSTMKRLAASGMMRREYENGGSAMAHPVKLRVIAGVPKDCNFWLEHDSWNGVCEELAVTVRGSSFEDAKRKMEAALQAHIEDVLRRLLRKGGKRAA